MKKIIIILFSLASFDLNGQDTINVGTSANDGTGDPIRTAFQKTNNNDQLLFAKTEGLNSTSDKTTLTGDTLLVGQDTIPYFYKLECDLINYAHQGRSTISGGLNILPNQYNYSNLNLYYNMHDAGRGLASVNFIAKGANNKWRNTHYLGLDSGTIPVTADSIPPLLMIGSFDSCGVAHDYISISTRDYLSVTGYQLYKGMMGINYAQPVAPLSVATGSWYPSETGVGNRPIMQLTRSSADSTNPWLKFTHGNAGEADFVWQDSLGVDTTMLMTFYGTSGGISPYNGIGTKIYFGAQRNKIKIITGGYEFDGGATILNHRWEANSTTAALDVLFNHSTGSQTIVGHGLRLFNTSTTYPNKSPIFGRNGAGANNTEIAFWHLNASNESAISFFTRNTSNSAVRIWIKKTGDLWKLHGEIDSTSAVNNIVAGTGITSAMFDKKVIRVQGSGGSVDVTANPQIVASDNGRIIEIWGESNTNTVTFDDGDGLQLKGGTSCVLGLGDLLMLRYFFDVGLWREVSRSDN